MGDYRLDTPVVYKAIKTYKTVKEQQRKPITAWKEGEKKDLIEICSHVDFWKTWLKFKSRVFLREST